MYQDKRLKAFDLFMKGKTLREIAKELKISRSSVERWSVTDLWVYERQKVWFERTAMIKEEVKTHFQEASTRVMNVLRQAAKESEAYALGEIPLKARKYRPKDLLRICAAAQIIGSHECDIAVRELEKMKKEVNKLASGD